DPSGTGPARSTRRSPGRWDSAPSVAVPSSSSHPQDGVRGVALPPSAWFRRCWIWGRRPTGEGQRRPFALDELVELTLAEPERGGVVQRDTGYRRTGPQPVQQLTGAGSGAGSGGEHAVQQVPQRGAPVRQVRPAGERHRLPGCDLVDDRAGGPYVLRRVRGAGTGALLRCRPGRFTVVYPRLAGLGGVAEVADLGGPVVPPDRGRSQPAVHHARLGQGEYALQQAHLEQPQLIDH